MRIAGVDECGRGPLAGPVVAAAVILPGNCLTHDIADSKTLSTKKRAILEVKIKKVCTAWAVAQIEAEQIDQINILQASLMAMKNAILNLKIEPDTALIDGIYVPEGLDCGSKAIIKGDAKYPCISAASILAKQHRDRLLIDYDSTYPGYGFASHKGYPTKAHLNALAKFGVTPIHRRSFAPIVRILTQCK